MGTATMRTYTSKPGSKRYRKHSPNAINIAVKAVQNGMSYRKAAKQFGVPATVIHRHLKDPGTRKHGGQCELSEEVEEFLVKRLITCADWGYPLDTMDLRMIVKAYLDRRGVNSRRFSQNMPSADWVHNFVKRHKDQLAKRMCQNIKRSRAAVTPEAVNGFFDNLSDTLKDVPPSNIMNYDETNLSDDPGRKKILTRRGTKYPERVMNASKSATSVMYAGFADGHQLPPYIVYKATNMYDTWTVGGPPGTRYNRSKSGWFDQHCFADWFNSMALPYLRRLDGKKVIIGDNLSSHLSPEVIEKCEQNAIQFCFLPANATHLLQPLDVAFFRPMKTSWRKVLERWKKGPGRREAGIPKDKFPGLVKEMEEDMRMTAPSNLKAGFAKCGISPLDRQKVLERLPHGAREPEPEEASAQAARHIDTSLVNLLESLRYGKQDSRNRKRKVDVQPGKSITGRDFLVNEASGSKGTSDVRKKEDEDSGGEGTSGVRKKGGDKSRNKRCKEIESESTSDEDSGGEGNRDVRKNGSGMNRKKRRIETESEGSSDEDEPQEVDEDIESLISVLDDSSSINSDNAEGGRSSPDSSALPQPKAGDYVIFEYEGEQFPGQVTSVQEHGCYVKSMVKSGLNWKWPKKNDEMFYMMSDIKQKIKPPKEQNRGVLVIEELKARWDCF